MDVLGLHFAGKESNISWIDLAIWSSRDSLMNSLVASVVAILQLQTLSASCLLKSLFSIQYFIKHCTVVNYNCDNGHPCVWG